MGRARRQPGRTNPFRGRRPRVGHEVLRGGGGSSPGRADGGRPEILLAAAERLSRSARDQHPLGRDLQTTRSRLVWPTEQAMGVGAVLVVLAGYGLLHGDWSRRRRVGLAGAAVGGVALLGAGTTVAGGRLFLLLFDYAPGWRSVRTPGRLVILVTLALALLAANGADQFRRGARSPRVIGVVLVGLVLLDGHGSLATPRVPAPSPGLAAAADPVLVLPSDDTADMQAMWASTDGFPRIVNGVTGFIPATLAEAQAAHGRVPRPGIRRLPAPTWCAQRRPPAGAGPGHAVGRRRGPLGEWPRRDGSPRRRRPRLRPGPAAARLSPSGAVAFASARLRCRSPTPRAGRWRLRTRSRRRCR